MTLYKDFYVICIGRGLFGFFSGVLLSTSPKLVEETVPARLLDYGYGVFTNIMINVAIMYSMILGFGVPADVNNLGTTNFWRIIYGI
jgi:MFS family permease